MILNFIDFFSLKNPWYILFIAVMISIYIFLRIYYPIIIGKAGERWTKKELKKLPEEYLVIKDLFIINNDKSCQIDYLVVSKYGIFVIETKQYNGYITGDKYDKNWVRHYRKNKKIYYTNAIKQNYGHIKNICEVLNIDESKVFNLVHIPSDAVIKITDDGETVLGEELANRIQQKEEIIIENYEEYYNLLNSLNIKSKKERKKHIKRIRELKKEVDPNDVCPKCGGTLVIREKYTKFLGCSNYPKCKYSRRIR